MAMAVQRQQPKTIPRLMLLLAEINRRSEGLDRPSA
jgi:hypothetical protein